MPYIQAQIELVNHIPALKLYLLAAFSPDRKRPALIMGNFLEKKLI